MTQPRRRPRDGGPSERRTLHRTADVSSGRIPPGRTHRRTPHHHARDGLVSPIHRRGDDKVQEQRDDRFADGMRHSERFSARTDRDGRRRQVGGGGSGYDSVRQVTIRPRRPESGHPGIPDPGMGPGTDADQDSDHRLVRCGGGPHRGEHAERRTGPLGSFPGGLLAPIVPGTHHLTGYAVDPHALDRT